MVWRVVFANVATLSEIEMSWSLDDLLRASALIDMREDIEYYQNKQRKP